MTHLTPDELIDAVEDTLAPVRRAHLTNCEHCRAEAEGLASVLGQVRTVQPVEPSPLFWDRFSDRVRTAIAADAAPRGSRWFEWPVLVPLGALAVLVVALVSSVPLGTPDSTVGPMAAIDVEAIDATQSEERWAMVFDLVGELDLDAVVESGFLGRPGTAERAIAHLTSTEREELVRLLREELRSGG